MSWAQWAWALLTVVSAIGWLYITVVLFITHARLCTLSSNGAEFPAGEAWPTLSVIVPARNEEAHIERTIRSLLAQDYPFLEIVAIDDRSEDRTGEILARLADANQSLSVLHVKSLPDGWLGKNHANHLGARQALGARLLFTDGDVIFAEGVLRAAIAFMTAHNLGHLVATPRLIAPGFLERAFQASFVILFCLRFRVWELHKARSAAYIGLGAFNLVRRDDYLQVGGHQPLALEVIDDVKLGLILRRSGVRQGLVYSGGMVAVRWQPGFLALVHGLVKNAFAGAEWSWWRILYGSLGIAIIGLFPLVAMVAAPQTWLRVLAALSLSVSLVVHGLVARHSAQGSGLEGLAYPIAHLALIAVSIWSAALATLRGEIVWRDTRYPVPVLRAGCVRESNWPASAAVGEE